MKKFVALLVVIGALVAAQGALANSTVLNSYGSNSAKPVLKVVGTKHVAGAVARSGKTLPFTGIDLVVVTFAGIALLGLGLGLRQLGRDRS